MHALPSVEFVVNVMPTWEMIQFTFGIRWMRLGQGSGRRMLSKRRAGKRFPEGGDPSWDS